MANIPERGVVIAWLGESFKFWWAPTTYRVGQKVIPLVQCNIISRVSLFGPPCSCHVDRLRCCQLRWTVSVLNKLVMVVGHQFIKLTVDICVQHGGRKAPRRAGLSAATETC